MKKETKIEIFFWLVVLFVFSPRILLEVYEKKLRDSLTPFENNEWTVKDKDGNVIYEKLKLPHDLRWQEQKTNRREWIFEKDIRTDNLTNLDDLGIVLGRVGDSDYVMFNDCMIGSTGVDIQTKKVDGWGWSQLRRYQVPKYCITFPISHISIKVFKVFGPGFGVYAGSLGTGKFHEIQDKAKLVDFFKYIIPTVFGLGLIFFIGIHYLFIFLVSEKREIYGIFSLLSISVGIYLFITGLIPFLFTAFVLVTIKLLFFSAFSASILFLAFFDKKFNIFNRKVLYFYVGMSSLLFLFVLFKKNLETIYQYYEYWYLIFLLVFVICYIQMFLFKFKIKNNIYFNKYLLVFSIFVMCCIHDVIVSVFAYSNSYLIGYAFTFFVIVVALTLSREYSEAFSKVEEQVVERTKQLQFALSEVQSLQIKKDDQARNFAHDIRSPLVALQVLKDIVSKSLSDDQRSLLKHTIIRINDLANTILPKVVEDSVGMNTSVFLWSTIDKLISEKRVEYQSIQNCTFEIENLFSSSNIYVHCDETDLTRVLSNVINNAVEARKIDQAFKLVISTEKKDLFVEIKIRDNGKGIKAGNLNRVFHQGFTQGKIAGTGLGLTNAKKTIENFGGKIDIVSIENQETTITIRLPLSEKPVWLANSLNLKNIVNLVIIDDQPYVIEAWKQKLQSLSKLFKIYWVQNMDDWNKNPLDHLSKELTMFLVDYDLSNGLTGLDMIEQLKLFPNLCIVTANEDDLKLREKAVTLGICILPKSLISSISIEI